MGTVIATRGDVRFIEAGNRLSGNVIAHRQNNINQNIGGNIWSIKATTINSDLIRADNAIGRILTGTLNANTQIILQMGGTLITQNQGQEDEFETFTVNGGPLTVRITNGPFQSSIIYTFGTSADNNPLNFVFNNIPAAWKFNWENLYQFLDISSRRIINNRIQHAFRVLWFPVIVPDFNVPNRSVFTRRLEFGSINNLPFPTRSEFDSVGVLTVFPAVLPIP